MFLLKLVLTYLFINVRLCIDTHALHCQPLDMFTDRVFVFYSLCSTERISLTGFNGFKEPTVNRFGFVHLHENQSCTEAVIQRIKLSNWSRRNRAPVCDWSVKNWWRYCVFWLVVFVCQISKHRAELLHELQPAGPPDAGGLCEEYQLSGAGLEFSPRGSTAEVQQPTHTHSQLKPQRLNLRNKVK